MHSGPCTSAAGVHPTVEGSFQSAKLGPSSGSHSGRPLLGPGMCPAVAGAWVAQRATRIWKLQIAVRRYAAVVVAPHHRSGHGHRGRGRGQP